MRADRMLRMEKVTSSVRDWLVGEHSKDITWGPRLAVWGEQRERKRQRIRGMTAPLSR